MKETAGKLKLSGEANRTGISGEEPADGSAADVAVAKDAVRCAPDDGAGGDEDEYEYSNWDEEEDEAFVRPEEIVPVFSDRKKAPDAAEVGGFVKPVAASVPATGVPAPVPAPVPAQVPTVTSAHSAPIAAPGSRVAAARPVAVPMVAKGGRGKGITLAACLVAAVLVAGVAYSVKEMRALAERLARMESMVKGGATPAENPGAGEQNVASGSELVAAVAARESGVMDPAGAEAGDTGGPAPAADAPESVDGGVAEKEATELRGGGGRMEERILHLEQRARLTKLGDEAISSGSRYAFNQLEAEFEKPGMMGLKVAANSEIIRVESMYASTASMSYRAIPVDIIDPTLKSDTELSIAQLGDILLSSSVAAEVRARAAELLAQFRSYDACVLLVECIRTEPNLAVLVQATQSFRKLTGYPGARVFAGPALEEWFQANRAQIKMAFGEGAASGQ